MRQEIDDKHIAKLPTALFIETLCFLPHVTIALVSKDSGAKLPLNIFIGKYG